MKLDCDVAVIGAGVVGLAVAAEVAAGGASVVLVEQHPGPGRVTSSRNSEVIHAGLYYPTGSWKARLCVAGNPLLYSYCESRKVVCRAIGKLVIAVEQDEIPELERITKLAEANGARQLQLLEASDIHRLEPAVRAVAGLLSPSTGIVDTHGLIKALEADVRSRGGVILYCCRLEGFAAQSGGYRLELQNPAGREPLCCRAVVNAAGLQSDQVASLMGLQDYSLHWCKGDYFSVGGRSRHAVSRLIYPVPCRHLSSLGVHVTLDLGGRMRLGPDATFLDQREEDYDVSSKKVGDFWEAAHRYLPCLQLDELEPDTAGIRPKLQGPGQPFADFVLQDEKSKQLPGVISLVGIESPGLTSCLAIGREVQDLLKNYI